MNAFSTMPTLNIVVPAAQIDARVQTFAISLSDADAPALAAYLDIPAVKHLRAKLRVDRSGVRIRVRGEVTARLERTCVVSLDPMEEAINETFDVAFEEVGAVPALAGEFEADLDAPEPLPDGQLHLGAVVAEQLVLAMSAHPRLPAATPPVDPAPAVNLSPFAVLRTSKTD